ncbi:MAG: hypothetical protein ACR5LC_03930 [Symbiopectobacterium sp.]|uniref:hypothetical protein n=1 Tax=Symbiopectobacterium sp. TaxID=2952789 RepID=UPI003F377E0F
MAIIKWAILGTGTIAKSFAQVLCQLADAEHPAVGSHSLQHAEQFGERFPAQKYYGSDEQVTVLSCSINTTTQKRSADYR